MMKIIGKSFFNNTLYVLFNERIMMAITREDDFVRRAEDEWRNSSERERISRKLKLIYKKIRMYNSLTGYS
jgi:hypothetical protein